jgi:molecular chaperone DnaK
MVKEGERFAEQDRERKEEIETRNMADSAIYTAEKSLRDLGDKVTSDAKADIESRIGTLRTTLQGKDINAIKQQAAELAQAVQEVGAQAYQEQAGPTPPPDGAPNGDPESTPNDDSTVEGEFREV